MPEQRFDAVVIGAGPGGYPAAIRLGQLKVKTCVIEREYMGGVCLNVGCIPSKAVIHASKMFDKMSHADEIGIAIASKPTLDMKKLQAWKGGVVGKLTGGVRTLLKGNGVEIVERKLRKMGVEVLIETKAKSWEDKGDRAVLTVELKDGKAAQLDADKILLSVGRRPNSENLGLDAAGVAVDKRGYVTADDHLRTNVAGIYAIGDLIGGMMLAHKAT